MRRLREPRWAGVRAWIGTLGILLAIVAVVAGFYVGNNVLADSKPKTPTLVQLSRKGTITTVDHTRVVTYPAVVRHVHGKVIHLAAVTVPLTKTNTEVVTLPNGSTKTVVRPVRVPVTITTPGGSTTVTNTTLSVSTATSVVTTTLPGQTITTVETVTLPASTQTDTTTETVPTTVTVTVTNPPPT